MVDNVGTDLLQNYNVSLDKDVDHVAEMVKMIRGFTQMILYFNELSYKYYSDFNSFIGLIEIIVDNKIVNQSYSFDAHNVIKYRY